MLKTLNWAALPPTAKLCLEKGIAHNGLLKTERGYIGRTDTGRAPARFSAADVAVLMREGLATASSFDERLVSMTDAALVLFHLGAARVEVAA